MSKYNKQKKEKKDKKNKIHGDCSVLFFTEEFFQKRQSDCFLLDYFCFQKGRCRTL